MLERAVGCLEFAGQGVLQKYLTVFRSQKSLDPNFWKCQISDTDVRLWQSGLHHEAKNGRPAPISTQASPDFFLDFLYPRRCLVSAAAWVSKHKKGHLNIQKRRRVYNFMRSYCQTSRSRSHCASDRASRVNIPRTPRRTHATAASSYVPSIENIGPSTVPRTRLHRDYDRAWVLWETGDQERKSRSQLMAYFSTSDRSLDVERAISLLEGINVNERRANDYENMIQPLLGAGHLPAVERLCDDAVSKGVKIDVWSLATKIAIRHSKWPELSHIWNKKHEGISQALPSILASLRDLPGLLNLFLDYLQETSTSSTDLQLASDILGFVFRSDKIMRDIIVESALSLTRKSANLGFLQQSHYETAIQTLLKIGTRPSRVLSMILYRNFRWHLSSCRPTKTLIHQLLEMLAAMKTRYGVQFLLDEFAHFFKQPSIGAYNFALLAFSRSGDVAKTQETFDEMVELYGISTKNPNVPHKTPRTPRWVGALIHAHARLGDYPSAEQEFHKIAHVYKVHQSRQCWNALISAHANARNSYGAFRVWRRMNRKGMKPDWYTYGTLMGMCARLGDIENTIELCQMAEKRPGKMPAALMDTVVEAYCRNQRFQEAEQMAERCLALSLDGSRTRMWNVLLWSHAFRADLDSVSRIQNRMKEAGIEFDEMTYAAMMLCFVVIGQPDSARRLLRGLQRGRRIQASEFHYTIVLYGYVKQGNRDMIYLINKEMEQRFKNPSMSARILMLRATLQRDTFVLPSQADGLGDSGYRLALTEDLLYKAVFDFDRRQFANKYPRPGTSSLPVHEAFPSLLYEPVLQAYSTEGMHRRTQQLLKEYAKDVESAMASDKRIVAPSLRFLSVLMEVYSQAENFETVQKCWELALERAGRMLIRSPVSPVLTPRPGDAPIPRGNISLPGLPSLSISDSGSQSASNDRRDSPDKESHTTEAPTPESTDKHVRTPRYPSEESIIPSQRYILSRHFTIYMGMVGKAGQSSKLPELVGDYQKRGFLMSSQNWLMYVRTLATSNSAPDQLEAFSTFERIFMPHFPGWRLLARGTQLRPPGVPSTIDLMDRRPIGKDTEHLGKKGSRLWTKLTPTWMHPTYNVMIYLAATLKDFRERSLTEGREQLDTLSSVAPRTLEAIAMMPHLREKYQGVLLRNQVEQGDLSPWQRRKYVWTGGVLGVGGKKRAAELVEEIDTLSEESEFEYDSSEILDIDGGEPEEHMETTEPTISPQDEHDIEVETLIQSRRRELRTDPLREEELSDRGSS
ncbi:translation regulator (Cya5), putative [Talaromyces stipitatus ATCC 10500]|uniref:Translation regulator (Cya5), putative n=1 Tax=Talaromyces stipitatus (strain ATCC 10500 / CBS 375.48 / QM 6759 / NRRL 1006) TaxID=441959 RepID=B8MFJ0_TALSN|nr:translation regulator (Cya5), putative [Talaromyces stipitatus ATCC 10500]EED16724.1 translation regulator (Cya5), putative [Talaromyces stipitatus ATCC 10500]